MLGKTAGGLYWMFRGLERAENTARLIDAGFRIALTRSTDPEGEWQSVIITAAQQPAFEAKYDSYTAASVIDFLLRDLDNPSSVRAIIKQARDNAKLVRTALTREVWVAVNEAWMSFEMLLREPVVEAELPGVLETIRQKSALVRGVMFGTMLRNDIFDFCRLGTYIERADSTARIVDVKYHTLLPAASFVGSNMDNKQWEMILRSVSAHRSFRWAVEGEYNAINIASFLILDERMPRSLAFCTKQIADNLTYLAEAYETRTASLDLAEALHFGLKGRDIQSIFDEGLHEFLTATLVKLGAIGKQIEEDYRFNH
jgi:uncharacterized alpha-E superfamily protein